MKSSIKQGELLDLEKFSNRNIVKLELRDWRDLDITKNLDLVLTFTSGAKRDIGFTSIEHVQEIVREKGYYASSDIILDSISSENIKKVLNALKW